MRFRSHRLMAAMLGLALGELAWAAPPPGWIIAGNAPANYVFSVEAATPVSGSKSASITAKPAAASNGFGTLMQVIAADDYRGTRLRLSGYLRTADAERSQMWMRVDGPNHEALAFDNMDSRPVTGTTGWKRYDIVLDVPQTSVDIAFGFFLAGSGKAWGADFQLDKVGTAVPVTAQDPILPRKPVNLNFEMAAAQGNAQLVADAPFPMIAAGDGRIFIYQTTSFDPTPISEIKLNGKTVGRAGPNMFFFGDQLPGDYIVTAVVPGRSDLTGRPVMSNVPDMVHRVTFHVNAGQVRYIRLDARTSPNSVTQVYPELVDEAVGRAQVEKIESTMKGAANHSD